MSNLGRRVKKGEFAIIGKCTHPSSHTDEHGTRCVLCGESLAGPVHPDPMPLVHSLDNQPHTYRAPDSTKRRSFSRTAR